MSHRRKTEKKEKEPLYQVTPKQIEQYKRMGYQQAVNECVTLLFWMTYIALRDEFDFGKTRMLRVMRRLGGMAGDLQAGYFDLVDCRTELKREIGLDIGDKGIFIPDEEKKK